MPGKINVYNLGAKGVNVVKSPIHLDDGELIQAQNLQIDQVASLGGIRRRDGITALNSSALAGAARGIIAPPLPDRSLLTRHYYTPVDQLGGVTANRWFHSTDRTTWTAISTGPAQPQQISDYASGYALYAGFDTKLCSIADKMYYVGAEAGLPTIHVWDGTTDYLLTKIPRNPRDSTDPTAIIHLIPYSSRYLLCTTHDSNSGTGRGRVFLVDITNGQSTQLGHETDLNGGFPSAIVVAFGKIWIGTWNLSGGSASTVRWLRPGDTTWTTDKTFSTARGYVHSLAVFKGLLYAGLGADVGTNGEIEQRSAAGTWSQVDVTANTGAGNFFGTLTVSADGGTLYAHRNNIGGATPIMSIRKSTDGASWSQDLALGDTNDTALAGSYVDKATGDILWTFGSSAGATHTIRRNASAAGVYTTVLTDTHVRGPIVSLKF